MTLKYLHLRIFMKMLLMDEVKKCLTVYGKIDEEVYVSQPLGFQDPKYPQKVYKVVKVLYGLHQAPRAWLLMKSRIQMIRWESSLSHWPTSQTETRSTPIETQSLSQRWRKPIMYMFITIGNYAEQILTRKIPTTECCQFRARDSLLAMQKSKPMWPTSTTKLNKMQLASCSGQVLYDSKDKCRLWVTTS
ncbi:ribonuclease H-like domain-containing protein [Tanacetum coccineum]